MGFGVINNDGGFVSLNWEFCNFLYIENSKGLLLLSLFCCVGGVIVDDVIVCDDFFCCVGLECEEELFVGDYEVNL